MAERLIRRVRVRIGQLLATLPVRAQSIQALYVPYPSLGKDAFHFPFQSFHTVIVQRYLSVLLLVRPGKPLANLQHHYRPHSYSRPCHWHECRSGMSSSDPRVVIILTWPLQLHWVNSVLMWTYLIFLAMQVSRSTYPLDWKQWLMFQSSLCWLSVTDLKVKERFTL